MSVRNYGRPGSMPLVAPGTPGSGFTLVDWQGLSHSSAAVEYKAIASPSGSYTVDMTYSNPATPSSILAGITILTSATAPVQYAAGATTDGVTLYVTLPSTPTPGNMLVWVYATNMYDLSDPFWKPTGWTTVFEYAAVIAGSLGGLRVAAHCVEDGDGKMWGAPLAHDKAVVLLEVAIT